ncbi:MAG TPA: sugar phosphate isomerase/epimerase [Lentisphaeria bacterium]|nr:MAG: xylose isomerase [Lentisphaerae bacterium GWF2_50_93]HCE44312.1 sugar phosphate isomerase/epimerase [Lentisphaeria bacterium]
MKYSIFTVSLPDLAPHDALREMKNAGYEGVEWRVVDQGPSADGKPGFWSGNLCTWPLKSFVDDADRIRKLAGSAGMEMPCVGTYVNCENLEAVETAMKGTVKLGAKQLRVGVPGYDGKSSYLKIRERAFRQYCDVAELARKYGVRALIEIHMGNITPSASAASAFVHNFDPKYVGVIHDAGNMVYEGYEQYGIGLEALGKYLAHVHLKSSRWDASGTRPDGSVNWKPSSAPFDKGIVDVTALLKALKDVGYDGWISFEDFSTEETTLQKMKKNIEFVKKVEASLN